MKALLVATGLPKMAQLYMRQHPLKVYSIACTIFDMFCPKAFVEPYA